MKRLIALTSIAVLLSVAVVLAGNVVKFSFADVTYPDGNMGTLRASSKMTKKSNVTVCSYFADPNDQYLGQFQSLEFASFDGGTILQFCLDHYDERQ